MSEPCPAAHKQCNLKQWTSTATYKNNKSCPAYQNDYKQANSGNINYSYRATGGIYCKGDLQTVVNKFMKT